MTKCLDDLKGMTLLADGEYISRPWFTYLVEVLQVNDIIRVPINDYKRENAIAASSNKLALEKWSARNW